MGTYGLSIAGFNQDGLRWDGLSKDFPTHYGAESWLRDWARGVDAYLWETQGGVWQIRDRESGGVATTATITGESESSCFPLTQTSRP